jgi:pSer/pThr/pTyr-binding forkhead associated (FHA) protein
MRLYVFKEDTTFLEVTSRRSVIGRAPDCDLVITATAVHRRHAEVIREADAYFISDLGSTCGIWLVNVKREIGRPHRIADGEQYTIGTTQIAAMLRETPLQTPLTLALEDDVAAHPTDAARRRVWVDALIEQGDPLGTWLRAPLPQGSGSITSRGGVELSWDGGLIRRAVVSEPIAGEEVLRSRLAAHLVELIVDASDSAENARRIFLDRLKEARLPALQHVQLRGFGGLPQALPLAPRLRRLEE